MEDFNTGTVRANQLTFAYLTAGDGPLALCVHGFPDSPYSYRFLLPALARDRAQAVRYAYKHRLAQADQYPTGPDARPDSHRTEPPGQW